MFCTQRVLNVLKMSKGIKSVKRYQNPIKNVYKKVHKKYQKYQNRYFLPKSIFYMKKLI